MEEQFSVRDLQASDRSLFMTMMHEFYHSSATIHPISDEQLHKIFDLSLESSPYYRAVILLIGETIVGYAHLSFTHSNEVAGMVLLIEELYIRTEYRGKGIGSQFFSWLFDNYRDRMKRFRLEATPQNEGAIQLYRRQGFTELAYKQMVYDFHQSTQGEKV